MVTVTTAVKVKIVNPGNHDVLYTGSHAQKIIDGYTNNWCALSPMFLYYNPIITYSPMMNLFYITYELDNENDFARADFAVVLSCPKYLEIKNQKYELRVEIV